VGIMIHGTKLKTIRKILSLSRSAFMPWNPGGSPVC
jgi:hypothetical protein